jgi:hypothetical protein
MKAISSLPDDHASIQWIETNKSTFQAASLGEPSLTTLRYRCRALPPPKSQKVIFDVPRIAKTMTKLHWSEALASQSRKSNVTEVSDDDLLQQPNIYARRLG